MAAASILARQQQVDTKPLGRRPGIRQEITKARRCCANLHPAGLAMPISRMVTIFRTIRAVAAGRDNTNLTTMSITGVGRMGAGVCPGIRVSFWTRFRPKRNGMHPAVRAVWSIFHRGRLTTNHHAMSLPVTNLRDMWGGKTHIIAVKPSTHARVMPVSGAVRMVDTGGNPADIRLADIIHRAAVRITMSTTAGAVISQNTPTIPARFFRASEADPPFIMAAVVAERSLLIAVVGVRVPSPVAARVQTRMPIPAQMHLPTSM